MMTSRILFLVQGVVSILLLGLLLTKLDLAAAMTIATGAQPQLLVVAFALLFLLIPLGAARWTFILRTLDLHLPLSQALRFVWVGTLFSQALPASIGGDAVRVWLLWRASGRARPALSSVVIERGLMLAALALLIALAQPLLASRIPFPTLSYLPAIILASVAAGIIMLAMPGLLPQRFLRFPPMRMLTALGAEALHFALRPKSALLAMATCLLSYFTMTLSAWVIMKAFSLEIRLIECFSLMPLVILASTVPISIGGWGVREGAMIFLLFYFGVDKSTALAVSLLFGVAGIFVSFPGILFWLHSGYKRSDIGVAAPSFSEVQED